MNPQVLVGFLIALAALGIPGPCSFDRHRELDCGPTLACPDNLVCERDGFCKTACAPDAVVCNGHCLGGNGGLVGGTPVNSGTGNKDGTGGTTSGTTTSVPAAFANDNFNCGACGNACNTGDICCNGTCIDGNSDSNCGQCNRSCFQGRCQDQQCVPECTRDADCSGAKQCCNQQCIDTTSDPNNCGGCNSHCDFVQACTNKQCRTGRDPDCCGGQCQDCSLTGQVCQLPQGGGGNEPGSCGSCTVASTQVQCPANTDCVITALGSNFTPATERCLAESAAPVADLTQCTPSNTTNPCAPGSSCITTGTVSACVRACDSGGAVGCTDPTTTCARVLPGGNPQLCLRTCTPTSNTCGAGLTCFISGATGCQSGVCVPQGNVSEGGSCDGTPDSAPQCATGLVCGGDKICHLGCNPNANPTGCPGAQRCTGVGSANGDCGGGGTSNSFCQ
jgi:hypothetical protein